METYGEFTHGPAGVAGFDQVKAAAAERLRDADGFILVTAKWENEDDMKIVQAAGVHSMNAAVFMALATAEVTKTLKAAVLADAGGEVEEIDGDD